MKRTLALLVMLLFLNSCHVYYEGMIINGTKDSLLVTTKPSLLIFNKDKFYNTLKEVNIGNDSTIFKCYILPYDTLFLNSGPVYTSSIAAINFLKIENKRGDSLVLNSKREIWKEKQILHRGFYKIKMGLVVTPELLNHEKLK